MRILAHAPTLADELARRSDLLDTLIDRSAFDLPGSVEEIVAELARGEAGDDYQRLLDAVRVKVSELRFALGVQLIEGQHDPLEVAAALSRVAEAAIEVLGAAAVSEFKTIMARFGQPSGDPRPWPAGRRCADARLGPGPGVPVQRRSHARKRRTAAAGRHVVLQPAGAARDRRAVRADGGRRALRSRYPAAALGRAGADRGQPRQLRALPARRRLDLGTHGPVPRPPLFGTAQAGELRAIIDAVLLAPRDAAKLREDVLHMRGEMAKHKPPRGRSTSSWRAAGWSTWSSSSTICSCASCGAGPGSGPRDRGAFRRRPAAPDLRAAYDLLVRLLIVVRLVAPDGMFPPEASRCIVANACCGKWRR
jgi:glutamate-ammonia-ligase adenylyltransferase